MNLVSLFSAVFQNISYVDNSNKIQERTYLDNSALPHLLQLSAATTPAPVAQSTSGTVIWPWEASSYTERFPVQDSLPHRSAYQPVLKTNPAWNNTITRALILSHGSQRQTSQLCATFGNTSRQRQAGPSLLQASDPAHSSSNSSAQLRQPVTRRWDGTRALWLLVGHAEDGLSQ